LGSLPPGIGVDGVFSSPLCSIVPGITPSLGNSPASPGLIPGGRDPSSPNISFPIKRPAPRLNAPTIPSTAGGIRGKTSA